MSSKPQCVFRAAAISLTVVATLCLLACGGGPAATPVAVATAPPPATTTERVPLALATLVAASAVPTAAIEAAVVYTDPQRRFVFTVPNGYQEASPPPSFSPSDRVVHFRAPMMNGGVSVAIQPLESGISLDLKTALVRQTMSKLPDYLSLTPPTETTVAGRAARQFEFTFTESNGTRHRSLNVTTINGADFYTLTIQHEEKDFRATVAQARVFVDTFMFLSAPPAA